MKSIKPFALKTLLDHQAVILLDVRQHAEYVRGFIKHSYHIPLNEISVEKLPLRSKPIVIYCHSGVRSQLACHKLLEEDPSLELYSLEGGIVSWKKAHFPVVVASRSHRVWILLAVAVTYALYLYITS